MEETLDLSFDRLLTMMKMMMMMIYTTEEGKQELLQNFFRQRKGDIFWYDIKIDIKNLMFV